MDKNNGSEYPVGYKKPPRHTRFKPGQSGNAKGRPRKDKSVVEVVLKELRGSVTITQGNRTLKVSKLEAIIKQHIARAASGDAKSTTILMSLLKPSQTHHDDKLPALLQEFRERNIRDHATDHKESQTKDENGSGPGSNISNSKGAE
jgi:hypothetical protein